MKTSSLAAALLLPLAVLAQTSPLISVDDPEGDDNGDGSLVYPRDSAFRAGDLDLRSLRVFADGADLRFEATFRNTIRDPATVISPGMGSESMALFARNGFFSFNLDIYLDTDRVPGSGNTVTLPGRRATLAPAHAWEKAIVLTPRPELIKREFVNSLRETSSANMADVVATVDRSVFFPTQVRVQGRTVSFVVPASFVDAAALKAASITAMVTAAQLTIDAGLSLVVGTPSTPRERFPLGVAQPDVGEPQMTMGFRNAPTPATSVVDLLSPDPGQQSLQLAQGGLLVGLNRENNMGAAPPTATVRTAVTPAPAAASAGSGSWFSSALAAVTGLFSSSPAPAAAPAASSTPQTVQSLMAPPAAVASPVAPTAAVVPPPAAVVALPVRPAPAAPAVAALPPPVTAAPAAVAPAATRPRDAAFFEEQEYRLRTLKRLRDSGLISEDEYVQKRREVLGQL